MRIRQDQLKLRLGQFKTVVIVQTKRKNIQKSIEEVKQEYDES